jgi:ABC-2 type transport system ATP-binding protein
MHALDVQHLSKSFDSLKAVDDVSFTVPEGSVFGLIGRNGAGKTTTIRMMMNIYLPDSGEVILRGSKVGQEFKDKAGYLPEERGLYKKMKVLETLLFFAELKGKSGKEVLARANEYLDRFDLLDRKNSKLEDLSKGNQQKVQFITTILHDPEFIILDEPFSGLDPINTNLLKEIILELKQQEKVIIFSTHLMDFAERLCDHIAMIDEGKIILHGNLEEIKRSFGQRNVTISHVGDISFVKEFPFVEKFENYGNVTSIRVKNPAEIQDLLKHLVQKEIVIKKFDAEDISLQQIFIETAGRSSIDKYGTGVTNV